MMRTWQGVMFGGIALMAAPTWAQWSNPVTVGTGVPVAAGQPAIATSGLGHWIIVWERTADGTVSFSRSANRGQTWSTPGDLLTLSGSNSQGSPSIASDVTSGTFLAAWQSDNFDGSPDATIARTTHQDTQFPAVASVNTASTYQGMALPIISGGGNNTWVVAGTAANGGATDEALRLFRSINNGQSWTPTALLGDDTATIRFDRNADLAADRSGNWMIVTESRSGSAGSPSDIFVRFSESTDSGEEWSDLSSIDSATPRGQHPRVSAAAEGQFLALLERGTATGNLLAYRTLNVGGEWAGPISVNASGEGSSGNLAGHDIATDPEGNAVAVWSAPVGTRNRLFYATSRDLGATWTPAAPLTVPTGDVSDELPVLQYDGSGRWAAAWQRNNFGTSTSLTIHSAVLAFPVRADLSVTQTDNPDPATVGDLVTYNMTVKNDGPSSAPAVTMINTITSGVEVVGITQTQGTRTETSGTTTFDFGDILEGASAGATLQVRMPNSGFFSSVAQVFNETEDPDTADRISTETTRVLVEGVDLTGEWQSFEAKVPRRPYKGRLDVDSKLVVRNMGNKKARGFKVLLMVSHDEILSEDDALVGVIGVPHLGPGNERKLDFEEKLRRYVPWHGRHLLAVIDAEMRVEEADEFNNNVATEELPLPDPGDDLN